VQLITLKEGVFWFNGAQFFDTALVLALGAFGKTAKNGPGL